MNYQRVKKRQEEKLREKRKALASLNGKQRTEQEKILMAQAEQEVVAEDEKPAKKVAKKKVAKKKASKKKTSKKKGK